MQETQNAVATSMTRRTGIFFGWRVVGAAFVLAVLGWGISFYAPPVYLQAIQENRGWPVALISTAVDYTFRHWCGRRGQSANILYAFRRSGGDEGGCNLLSRWHPRLVQCHRTLATLCLHTLQRRGLGGDGRRSSQRYRLSVVCAHPPRCTIHGIHGASIGGVVFSPLWVAGISVLGFPLAAATIGVVMAVTMWVLADRLFSRTPREMGLRPDGDARLTPVALVRSPAAQPRPGASLWQDLKFLTLLPGWRWDCPRRSV